MQGDKRVIEYLNKALRSELTAINQYWLHYRIFDNWGFNDLAKKWREESIEEMHHADELTHRILFLDGFPTCRPSIPCASGRLYRRSSKATSPRNTGPGRSTRRLRPTARAWATSDA